MSLDTAHNPGVPVPASDDASAEAALPPCVAVVGPTASGKTGLALALGEALGGEVLNTDAMQVYRGFDIGTAKPTPAERARLPHHLLDVVAPDETYSAGAYVADATRIARALAQRRRLPVLCGGTGLYFRALLQGLAAIPPVPAAVRAAVAAELSARGAAACHAELAAVDPEAAAAVHPNDPVRIARGLEVYRATGRPISAYRRERPFRAHAAGVLSVGYAWPRAELYARIDERVRAMLATGWVAEVEGLLAAGWSPALKPFQAIGYREIVAMLRGERPDWARDHEALAEAIALRTRRYAKRQLTWFRKHPDIRWLAPGDVPGALAAVRPFLAHAAGEAP